MGLGDVAEGRKDDDRWVEPRVTVGGVGSEWQ